eukprot:gene12033-14074_t
MYSICNDMALWRGRFYRVQTKSSEGQAAKKWPSSRLCPSSVVYQNILYIYGGDNGFKDLLQNLIGEVKNDLWAYDLQKNTWTEISGIGHKPWLTEHSSVIHRGNMVVFGGSSGTTPQYSNCVYNYSFETKRFTFVPTNSRSPSARSAHTADIYKDLIASMVECGGDFYLIGGWDRKQYFHEMYALSMERCTWRKIDTNIGDVEVGLGQNSVSVYQNKIFIFGGYNSHQKSSTNDLFSIRLR